MHGCIPRTTFGNFLYAVDFVKAKITSDAIARQENPIMGSAISHPTQEKMVRPLLMVLVSAQVRSGVGSVTITKTRHIMAPALHACSNVSMTTCFFADITCNADKGRPRYVLRNAFWRGS